MSETPAGEMLPRFVVRDHDDMHLLIDAMQIAKEDTEERLAEGRALQNESKTAPPLNPQLLAMLDETLAYCENRLRNQTAVLDEMRALHRAQFPADTSKTWEIGVFFI